MTEKEIKESISLFLGPATSEFKEEWKNLMTDISYHFYKVELLINEFCDGDEEKMSIIRKSMFKHLDPQGGQWAILVKLVKAKDKREAH